MRFVVSFLISVVVLFATANLLAYGFNMREPTLTIIAIVSAISSFFISIRIFKKGKSGTELASAVIGTVKDLKEDIETNIEIKQADFYALAEEEVENGEIDKGIWSQALIKAKGDEKLRKVEYMKLRAKQLKKQS